MEEVEKSRVQVRQGTEVEMHKMGYFFFWENRGRINSSKKNRKSFFIVTTCRYRRRRRVGHRHRMLNAHNDYNIQIHSHRRSDSHLIVTRSGHANHRRSRTIETPHNRHRIAVPEYAH